VRGRPALLLLASLLLAGCGTSKSASTVAAEGEAIPGGVRVTATADWGRTTVAEGTAGAGPVLDATRAIGAVETTYGGRYVSAIGGEAGDGEREWVFWLNGIESAVGAADVEAGPDDDVWWDLHRWDGRVHLPAVVGQWPAPLSRALDRPVEGVTADPAAAEALAAVGVEAAQPASTTGPRAIVGASDALAERDATWRAALADPRAAGLTAWFEDGGIVVWDAEAGRAVPVPEARAVLVATTEGFTADGAPLVVLAGRTAADAEAAARALAGDPLLPRHHAAVCLDADGRIACSGGRGRTP
jgi:hypothetical protein